MKEKLVLNPDRFFSAEPGTRKIARRLYESVKDLPIISPHGHVDPAIFASPEYRFKNPVELFITKDHYLYRMLYSQGIPLEELGIGEEDIPDPRRIWKLFAENFHLFRATPTGVWLEYELGVIFRVRSRISPGTADEIYDELSERLRSPSFSPRALFDSFNIEALATTDEAVSELKAHSDIANSGWNRRIIPTLRTDSITRINSPSWKLSLEALEKLTGISINCYRSFIRAIEDRRAFFRRAGATSTDTAVVEPFTEEISAARAESIFSKALSGRAGGDEARTFNAHMLMEFARMSAEDGLVMQLHAGSFRDHNESLFRKFGPDRGCDIPVRVEFTRNMRQLLNKYGNNPGLTVIVFTLDESNYSRELAPLAGHYPCLKLGPPWWFHDSINGMKRYRENVIETAGLYNTAGFLDDTRAFPSIPARHDLARRIDCDWLAGLTARHIITIGEAEEMAADCAYNLAKRTYKL